MEVEAFKKLCNVFLYGFRKPIFYIIIIASFSLGYFNTPDKNFFILVPSILGIFLTGALTSLAITFTVLKDSELKQFKEYENKTSNNLFEQYLDSVKTDLLVIIWMLTLSIIILALSQTDIPKVTFPFTELIEKNKFYTALNLIGIFVSITCMYDIVESIFLLMANKYDN